MINKFDIIICVGPKDLEILTKQIKYTKKNIIGYRNIYIISYNPNISVDNCIIINENIFPFTINDVIKYHGKNERNGWYLQQILKLYAGFIIPNILDKYLVIDCDTFFIQPTIFSINNKCLYNIGNEYHIPYFIHMNKLHPLLKKNNKYISGICHHMIFDKKIFKKII